MTHNPNCDGGHCASATGEVRLYPLGGGANLILCLACWAHENQYRVRRGRETGAPENWPTILWYTGKRYPDDDEHGLRLEQIEAARRLSDDDVRRHASIATDNGPFDPNDGSFTTACELVRQERGLPHLHAEHAEG